MSVGSTTRRTSRVTSRTTRAGGGGGRGGGSAMGILAVIAFAVVAMGLFIIYLNNKRQAELAEANKTVPVIAAAVDLPAGKVVAANDITIKQVKPDSREPNAFTDASDPSLIGGVLAVSVSANQTILRNYMGVQEQRLQPKEGEREVTVTLSGINAKQNFIRKGQVVSVFRIFTTASGNTITKALSKYARILDVQRSDSVVSNAQNNGQAQADITLAVNPTDAKEILPYVANTDEIRLLDGPNQEAPESQVTLFQQYMGTEMEEKELTPEVGSSLVAKTDKKQ